MEAGQHITPTLRLVRPLGRGGMGAVWVADQLALGTQVAVKFMAASYAQNASLVQRFQREAMAAAQIKSPHVAQVFDHGVTASGEPYIVMELLEGEDLGARIRRAGPLPPAEVAAVVLQVGKALHRAHAVGIVHRDIKPDNIFLVNLDGEQLVKVVDFGIAKLAIETAPGMTATGSVIGTPLYMSPEQLLSSKGVDFRSDLWSLGVVSYFALTGRVPFPGETVGAISVAVHGGVYEPVTAARAGLPASLDAWMKRALAREPGGRFASAREMADALDRAVREPGAAAGAGAMGSGVAATSGAQPLITPAPSSTPAPSRTPAPSGTSGPGAGTMSDALTLVGTANTRGGAGASRVPMVAVGILVLAGLGAVGVYALRRSHAEAKVVVAGGGAAMSAAPVVQEMPPVAVVPSGAAVVEIDADAMAPAGTATAAATAARPVATGGGRAPAAVRPGPAATKPAAKTTGTAPGGKDTIGF